MHSVVVTGVGIISAIGKSVDEFQRRLVAGDSGIHRIQSFDPTECRTQIGAEIRDFDAAQVVSRSELNQLDRLGVLAIYAGDQAIADAGLDLDRDRSSLGVILGTGLGPSASIEESVLRASRRQRLRPATILKIMLNSPAAALCARYQCLEVSHVHATACASSAHAISQAADYIRRGELDLCLVGGSDAFPSPALFAAWDALGVMTPENASPQKAMRPFAADRSGFAVGEGAAVLVLESARRAFGRGATIHAEIVGTGSSSHAPSLTKPSVDAMAMSMSRSLQNAGAAAIDIGYVNAHGTATDLNDSLETAAIHRVFADQAPKLRISSTKAAHGHTMGASGAIEAVATILALNEGMAPPTLNLTQLDPICDLDYTPIVASRMDCSLGVTTSFAFGGHCASIVIRRGRDVPAPY